MTSYKLFLIVLLANLSYSQSEKIIPSIVDFDGVVYKSNEEIPYTGKVSTFFGKMINSKRKVYIEMV